MPRAGIGIHVLREHAIAPHEKVRGDFERCDVLEVGVRIGIQAILEKRVDPRAAEFARWKRDVVDDEELDRRALGTLVEIGRGNPQGRIAAAAFDPQSIPSRSRR